MRREKKLLSFSFTFDTSVLRKAAMENSIYIYEQVAVENMRLKREEESKAKELKDLEVRLHKARTKRMLNEKLKVNT